MPQLADVERSFAVLGQTMNDADPTFRESIRLLVTDAVRYDAEKRADSRMAFFRAFEIYVGDELVCENAFSLDLGPKGIGLVTPDPFEAELIILRTILNETELLIPARVVWSQQLASGWSRCGVEFLRSSQL